MKYIYIVVTILLPVYEFDYPRYFTLSGFIQYLSFCVCVISFSIMFSRFICIVEGVGIFILL